MRFALSLILISIFFNCNGQNDFSWLEGQWKNQKSGAIEEWVSTDEGLVGKVYKLNSTDTLIQEKLTILKIDDDWFYKAEVDHNPEPTLFKISTSEMNHLICENPEHDFPKQIEYTYDGELITVIISDGGDKKMGFQFKKIE